jgi:hypothetical protein
VAEFSFDQASQSAIHEILGNGPAVGNELNTAAAHGGVGALLHDPVIFGERSHAALGHRRNIFHKQARVSRFYLVSAGNGRRRNFRAEKSHGYGCKCWQNHVPK